MIGDHRRLYHWRHDCLWLGTPSSKQVRTPKEASLAGFRPCPSCTGSVAA